MDLDVPLCLEINSPMLSGKKSMTTLRYYFSPYQVKKESFILTIFG